MALRVGACRTGGWVGGLGELAHPLEDVAPADGPERAEDVRYGDDVDGRDVIAHHLETREREGVGGCAGRLSRMGGGDGSG